MTRLLSPDPSGPASANYFIEPLHRSPIIGRIEIDRNLLTISTIVGCRDNRAALGSPLLNHIIGVPLMNHKAVLTDATLYDGLRRRHQRIGGGRRLFRIEARCSHLVGVKQQQQRRHAIRNRL